MANTKPIITYGVRAGTVPSTGEPCKTPYITSLPQYDSMRLIEFALNSGYIRGQKYDLVGILNGIMDAALALIKAGNSVSIASWVRLYMSLRGQVGDDMQISAVNNTLALNATTMTDFALNIADFSWKYNEDFVRIRVNNLASPNGEKGKWTKTQPVVATGSNLVYNAGWGDKIMVRWMDEEQPMSIEIAPNEQSETYLKFAWATGLADVPAGTPLSVEFKLHGRAGGSEQVITKTVELVAAA